MPRDRFDNLITDGWEREGYVSIAIIILALRGIIITQFDPKYFDSRDTLSRLLVLAFFAYSILNYALVEYKKPRGNVLLVCLQAGGVILVSLTSGLTGGMHSPFYGLCLFVVFSAGYGWGVKGRLLTAGVCSVFLLLESIAASSMNHTRSLIGGSSGDVLCSALLLASYFIGYLREDEKRRHKGALAVRCLLGNADPDLGVKEIIEHTVAAVRAHFDADQIKFSLQEIEGDQAFLWEVRRPDATTEEQVQFSKLTELERKGYFACPMSAQNLKSENSPNLALLPSGVLHWPSQPRSEPYDMQVVCERHAVSPYFASLLAISFSLHREWFGRLVVCNPRVSVNPRRDSGFLEGLVREVGPILYNMHLRERLRSQARDAEQTHIAQELHDGTIQSLIGIRILIDLARKQAATDPSILLKEFLVVRELLEKEIEDLRLKMLQIRRPEVEPARLSNWMAELVGKFGKDFGITASFISPPQEVSLPPGVSSELASILREALVNIQKHSGASNVVVRFCSENGCWKLIVQDDGCGFGFAGRLTLQELDAARQGPWVIKERVRKIGGELLVESSSGSGARLVISVPNMPGRGNFLQLRQVLPS
jgi:signal transduction histidine kinase